MDTIAIDPGLSGAVAVLIDGKEPLLFDAPTQKIQGKTKRDFIINEMADILRPYVKPGSEVFLELVHAMPSQGGVSNFTFGRGRGLWEGIIAALGGHITFVTPQKWKKAYVELSPDKDKEGKTEKKKKAVLTSAEKKEQDKQKRLAKAAAKSKARELAAQMYPAIADKFARVSDDGRAEALLLACYGRNLIRS